MDHSIERKDLLGSKIHGGTVGGEFPDPPNNVVDEAGTKPGGEVAEGVLVLAERFEVGVTVPAGPLINDGAVCTICIEKGTASRPNCDNSLMFEHDANALSTHEGPPLVPSRGPDLRPVAAGDALETLGDFVRLHAGGDAIVVDVDGVLTTEINFDV